MFLLVHPFNKMLNTLQSQAILNQSTTMELHNNNMATNNHHPMDLITLQDMLLHNQICINNNHPHRTICELYKNSQKNPLIYIFKQSYFNYLNEI